MPSGTGYKDDMVVVVLRTKRYSEHTDFVSRGSLLSEVFIARVDASKAHTIAKPRLLAAHDEVDRILVSDCVPLHNVNPRFCVGLKEVYEASVLAVTLPAVLLFQLNCLCGHVPLGFTKLDMLLG